MNYFRKIRYIFLILLLFSIIQASSQVTAQTIWGPGNKYKIAYLQSAYGRLNSTNQISIKRLPVADFVLDNLTNTGYDYIFTGYNNFSLAEHVEMLVNNIPNVGSVEYPSGGFPVLLPLEFNGKSDWISSFANEIKAASNSVTNQNNVNFLNMKVTQTDTVINLSAKLRLNDTGNFNDQAIFNYPSLNLSFLNGTYENITISTQFVYLRSTGALGSFNYTIGTPNFTSLASNKTYSLYMSEQLNFVAIIPPSSIINRLPFSFDFSLFIFFIFVRKAIRKKYTNQ